MPLDDGAPLDDRVGDDRRHVLAHGVHVMLMCDNHLEELQKAVTRSNRAKVAANEGWNKRKSLKDNEAGHATASPQAYG